MQDRSGMTRAEKISELLRMLDGYNEEERELDEARRLLDRKRDLVVRALEYAYSDSTATA
jgi:hypothetical protein